MSEFDTFPTIPPAERRSFTIQLFLRVGAAVALPLLGALIVLYTRFIILEARVEAIVQDSARAQATQEAMAGALEAIKVQQATLSQDVAGARQQLERVERLTQEQLAEIRGRAVRPGR